MLRVANNWPCSDREGGAHLVCLGELREEVSELLGVLPDARDLLFAHATHKADQRCKVVCDALLQQSFGHAVPQAGGRQARRGRQPGARHAVGGSCTRCGLTAGRSWGPPCV